MTVEVPACAGRLEAETTTLKYGVHTRVCRELDAVRGSREPSEWPTVQTLRLAAYQRQPDGPSRGPSYGRAGWGLFGCPDRANGSV